MTTQNFFATCPKSLEGLLEQELIALGAKKTKQTVAGVTFAGTLELAYRVCLWSRLANRILLPLGSFPAGNAQILYDSVRRIHWLDHLSPAGSLMVDFAGHSASIINSHFGAQKVKDAIVDQIRDKTGQRPNVDKENPWLRVNVYLQRDIANISIDLSGESLHRRGYRIHAGMAPLKENLAAAILYRANWPELAKQNYPLLDPFCGSGTILIEGAMMAADIAPGLLRWSFGFQKWLGHQDVLWRKLWEEAEERREQGMKNLPAIFGFDSDSRAIESAINNAIEAELRNHIKLSVTDFNQLVNPVQSTEGLIVTNPPYGERLGNEEILIPLYREIGNKLRTEFFGWNAAILMGNPELGKKMGLRAQKQYAFFNGAIPCKLLLFKIEESWFVYDRNE